MSGTYDDQSNAKMLVHRLLFEVVQHTMLQFLIHQLMRM